jgi:hypothetical protein
VTSTRKGLRIKSSREHKRELDKLEQCPVLWGGNSKAGFPNSKAMLWEGTGLASSRAPSLQMIFIVIMFSFQIVRIL